MIVTETICDVCKAEIDTELPPWCTVSITIFPEKTPRVYHYCRTCYPTYAPLPDWAKPLVKREPITTCTHPMGPGTDLYHCSLCAVTGKGST